MDLFRFIFLKFFHPLFLLIPIYKERFKFELKNNYKLGDFKSFACFHISSEGEFEQSVFIMEFFLKEGKNIQILYTSKSVEKKVNDFCFSFPRRVLNLRVPLLYQSVKNPLFDWVNGSYFFMCRYDFFPSLMKLVKKKKSYLISGSLIGKNKELLISRVIYKKLYGLFDFIIPTSQIDFERFQMIGLENLFAPYEFRLNQIYKRFEGFDEKLRGLKNIQKFIDYLKENNSLKIIFGSSWVEDLNILKSKDIQNLIQHKKILVTIAPHSLSEKQVHRQLEYLKSILNDISIELIDKNNLIDFRNEKAKVYFLLEPGVLAEMYQFLIFHILEGDLIGQFIPF